MRPEPQRFQHWRNNRRGMVYVILGLPKWSDSPDDSGPDKLQRWVYMVDTAGNEYTRSLESFMGNNRDGKPRFTLVS